MKKEEEKRGVEGVGESVWVVARELIAPNHEGEREVFLFFFFFGFPKQVQKNKKG